VQVGDEEQTAGLTQSRQLVHPPVDETPAAPS
jgi:hypothetical protein